MNKYHVKLEVMNKAEKIALAFLGVTAVTALIFGIGKAMAGPKVQTKTDATTGKLMYLHPDGQWRQYAPPSGTGYNPPPNGGGDTGGGGFDPTKYLGDMCKRECDVRYMWPFGDASKRQACKADCLVRP